MPDHPSETNRRHPVVNEEPSSSIPLFKHPLAVVETENVGAGTRIWAFAHILPGASIGRDCNICDHVFIENDVSIGDGVTIKCGVQIWDGIRIEDNVFIGPNATFTNDKFPRSRHYREADRIPRTVVKRGASIGANATILPGITVGERAMVGAGAVVTHDVPPDAIVVGNPARITSYVGTIPPAPIATAGDRGTETGSWPTSVKGVALHHLPRIKDLRGNLVFGEIQRHVPFEIKRFFLVFDVSTQRIRGEHAHRELHQFLICIHGTCHVVADDGSVREEFVLDQPHLGLYLPPMTWAVQYKYSPDAAMLALASDYYSAEDYIRNYSDFTELIASRQ